MTSFLRLALLGTALIAPQMAQATTSLSLNYIGQQIVATGTQYGGTTIGGLSGIDYVGGASFIAISDDRSQINPARFYTLSLGLSSTSFSSVNFSAVTALTVGGAPYAPLAIDPESIRYFAPTGQIIYSSEGDKTNNINAFIRAANLDGTTVGEAVLPSYYQQSGPAGTTGVRNNLAFESLAISPDNMTITTATENALIQDGPAASFGVGSPSRIMTFNLAGNALAEYVYQVDPVSAPSTPPGSFSTNGLVELLDLGGGKYIAVERSFVTGLVTPTSATGNSIKLYEIDLAGATNVFGLPALTGGETAVSKQLLFDLDSLGIPLDNIEGVSFGPTLENGKRSLILVSDNNFAPSQFTQFLAFSVGGAVPEPGTWAMMIAGFGIIGCAMRRGTRTAVRFA